MSVDYKQLQSLNINQMSEVLIKIKQESWWPVGDQWKIFQFSF